MDNEDQKDVESTKAPKMCEAIMTALEFCAQQDSVGHTIALQHIKRVLSESLEE